MKSLAYAVVTAAALMTTPVMADMKTSLEQAMNGEHRSDKNKARNQYRNPVETMTFFGLEPGMTLMEIAPGGGWYTEVLAPAMRDQGVYIAGSYDPDVEGQPEYRYRQHQVLLDRVKNEADLYGQVQVATYSPPESTDLWEENSVDMVVTFRSSHGWTRTGSFSGKESKRMISDAKVQPNARFECSIKCRRAAVSVTQDSFLTSGSWTVFAKMVNVDKVKSARGSVTIIVNVCVL